MNLFFGLNCVIFLIRFMKKYIKYYSLIFFFFRGCKIFFFVNIVWFVLGFYLVLFVFKVGFESFKEKGRVSVRLSGFWGVGELYLLVVCLFFYFSIFEIICLVTCDIKWVFIVEWGENEGERFFFEVVWVLLVNLWNDVNGRGV